MLDREQLKKYLPHRSSMLLLDEAELVTDESGTQTAHAKKTFTGDEWFFDGHFPNNPVVPGVIQCEILAQTTKKTVCVPQTEETGILGAARLASQMQLPAAQIKKQYMTKEK